MGVGRAATGLCVQHHRSATGSGQGLDHLKILLFPLSERVWPWSGDGTKEPGLSCTHQSTQGILPCQDRTGLLLSLLPGVSGADTAGPSSQRRGRAFTGAHLSTGRAGTAAAAPWCCPLEGAHILPHSRKCSCLQLSCLCQLFRLSGQTQAFHPAARIPLEPPLLLDSYLLASPA